jgi:RNA polymerase sigma-70 factor (ECF subfamily)
MFQGAKEFQGLSDRDLVLLYKAGEGAAYDEIFRRYYSRVSSTCSRLVGWQDSEEATQETFMRALQALPRFNGQFYLSAWLTRIATNVCVDHLRANSRTNLIILPDVPETMLESGPEDLIGTTSPRFEKTMEEVQPSYARALALRALVGMSHNEMAGRLAVSPQQVKALLHRARKSFKRAWEKAEGWMVAPLLALRNFDAERSGSSGLAASPALTSVTVEHFAASVLIIAASFSAAPSAPPAQAAAQPRNAQMTETLDPRSANGILALAHDGSGINRSGPHDETAAEAEVPGLIDELVDTVRKASADDDGSSPGSNGGGSDKGPGNGTSQETVKKVRDTAAKAAQYLEQI